MDKHYVNYSDQDFTWLRVPHRDVLELGIVDEISANSAITPAWIYLKGEDVARFHTAAELLDWDIHNEVRYSERSTIRSYGAYHPALVGHTLKEGDVLYIHPPVSMTTGQTGENDSLRAVVETIKARGQGMIVMRCLDERHGNERVHCQLRNFYASVDCERSFAPASPRTEAAATPVVG